MSSSDSVAQVLFLHSFFFCIVTSSFPQILSLPQPLLHLFLRASSIILLPSSFSFQTPPPTKNSFFQMGTVALSSSMAQETACCVVVYSFFNVLRSLEKGNSRAKKPDFDPGKRDEKKKLFPYLERVPAVRRARRDDHRGLSDLDDAHPVRDGDGREVPARRGGVADFLPKKESFFLVEGEEQRLSEFFFSVNLAKIASTAPNKIKTP